MSHNRHRQGASVILSLVFLLLQAGRSHGQTPASSLETPTVPEILAKCREFFSTWKSVQLTSEADLMFFDDKNNAWKTTGYSQSKEAWDDIRWYSLYQEINRPVDFQHLLHAGFGEEVTVGDNVLGVSFEGRVPTQEEYDSRNFSLFDKPGTDFSVTFFDGDAGSKRRDAGKPSIQFPGGIHLLDELSSRIHDCKIEAVTMLDRPCWQISSDRASEMRSITVCPDLNYAPVEVRSILGVDFIDSKGKRLGDLGKEGNRKQSSESIKTVVAINQDVSEFTIHSTGLVTYQDGSRVGRGRVQRYRDIQRMPVP